MNADAMEALWPRARRYAVRYCRGTLTRLRLGDGGFYEADDFMQDVYLEFHALVRRWQAGELAGGEVETLYDAWQKQLARGGWRIYRRAPQRLWVGAELAVAPADLELDDEGAAEESAPLSPAALAQLTSTAGPSQVYERLERLQRVELALWRLRPGQRQALYLTALEGVPAARAAGLLGVPNAAAVYDRMYGARRTLEEEPRDGCR
ncbi:MAG: RNA polymerase sigma factor [Anaerolineae bacterium]